jgi:hypothetical protein
MKKLLFLFLFAGFTAQAQIFQDIFSGNVTNGATTTSTIELGLVNADGTNAFDTLKVFLQGGLNSTDSISCAVFVQVNLFGRWSQGLLIDSLVVGNYRDNPIWGILGSGPIVRYRDSSRVGDANGYIMRVDTLKHLWFSGQYIPTAAKAFLLKNTAWKMRIYAEGRPSQPPLSGNYPTNGVSVRVSRLRF